MTSRAKAVLFLCVAVFIIYSNSLGGEFVYDDEYFIVRNVAIRNLSNIPSFFTNPASVAFSQLAEDVYRPVAASSYAIDYFLWFYNTFGYHLENMVLHGLNSVLVFVLVSILAGDIFIAFFSALFFACHPVQTEAVSWISGRSSVLFLFFYLSSLILYVRSLKEKRDGLFAWSIVFYAVSIFTKEMAVTLPIILIAYDVHFFNKDGFRKKAMRYLPYIIITLFYLAVRAFMLKRVGQCGWWGGDPYRNALSAIAVIPEYLRLLVYPVKLCAFYVSRIVRSAADSMVISSVVILAAIFLSLPFIYRRSRLASFAILWFFITMLPVSNIVPLKALLAERFLYLPSIGFCILAATAFGKIRSIKTKNAASVAVILAGSLAVVYSARTMIRNEDWKTPMSISESIIKVSPLNSWGYTSLGAALIGAGRYTEAITPLKKAMVLSKNYAAPRNAIGFCYLQLGQYGDAAAMFEEAVRLDPKSLESISSLGVAYAHLNRNDDAIRQFKEAIALDRTFISAYLNLGAAYERSGDDAKAFELYNEIPRHTNSPQDIGISYIRSGDMCLRKGDKERALEYYNKTIEVCGNKFEELKQVARERIEKGPQVDITAN